MIIKELKQQLQTIIFQFLKEKGVLDPVVELERASEQKFGEYATNVALRYAKELKLPPMVIAKELTEHLHNAGLVEIDRVEYVPPGFINVYFSEQVFVNHVETILAQAAEFGQLSHLTGEKWVIEHTSPNPNKSVHLGHLRNNLVGMSLVRLLGFAGAEVVADCVYNNRGIAIAKAMYGFLAHMKKVPETPTEVAHFVSCPSDWYTPADLEMKTDVFIERCYVLAEKDFKNVPEVENIVRQMVVDWEANDEAVWTLWQHILELAYAGQKRTLDRLQSHWDKVWYEHEHYQRGKQYIHEGLDKGVFQKLEDGAVLTHLESEYNLPETVLLKKDGTALYITQDIALTDLKKKTYGADKLLWVVGTDQSLALQQLFAVCEQLGIGTVQDFTHVSYGYVTLKNQEQGAHKMSSRTGTVVLADDVIDGVKETILKQFELHDKKADEQTAEKLAVGAVKFAFLKSDRSQDMTFDVTQSVDVHGDSGMYVLYAFVRTQSILKKAGKQSLIEFTPTELNTEYSLVRSLVYFEDVVKKSVDDLSVHHIAQYLLELSSEFNSWYAKDTVLDGSVSEEYKLAITAAVGITLQNGLHILGIETVDKI